MGLSSQQASQKKKRGVLRFMNYGTDSCKPYKGLQGTAVHAVATDRKTF